MPFQTKIEFTAETWRQIEELCLIQATGEEIARVIGVDYDTLQRRIKEEYEVSAAEYIKALAAPGVISLRRAQWKNAIENENTTMQIWLGKQYLGQKDKEEVDQNTVVRVIDQSNSQGTEDPNVVISD
jgi:hypothetical protein